MRKPVYDHGSRVVVELPPIGDGPRPRSPDAPPATFVELCARSTFSGLSIHKPVEGASYAEAARGWPGAGQPDEIVERACALGYDTIAVTDVDTVAGMVRAFRRAKELNLRFIVGIECWLDEGPLILHAATMEGYTNLCALITESRKARLRDDEGDDKGRGEWLDKFDVAYSLDEICQQNAGLFATALPPFDDAAVERLRETFGERLSLGVYRHQTPEDGWRWEWAKRLNARFQIPLLATGRPILVDAADKRFHDVLTCARMNIRLSEAGQRLMPNGCARLYSPEEMEAMFADAPEALARAREVADACVFELGEIKYAFPTEVIDGKTPQERLRTLAYAGACRRYRLTSVEDLDAAVRAQLEHELALIAELDVAAYFLTVYEIVEIARERGILCQGRGSAANSVVCFCLGVTSIDPVRMGLLFERFLSVERGEPPDIDVDFEHERREEVIQEIYRRYGRDHAAIIATCTCYRGRSAIREVGKVFGLTETVTGKLSGSMWRSALRELAGDAGEARLLASGIDVGSRVVRRVMEFADRIQGHPRHLGIHVGGFVLTAPKLSTLAPTEPARMENRTIIPFDKDDVEALGLFKMDVLGLGMLTCIRKGLALIDEHFGRAYDLATIPTEDPVVYDALCRADSIGVFQVESRAQMAMLPRLKPRSFYDLVVQVAIIRPGPIQGGMVHPYLRRRNGEEPVDVPHEALRPILDRTLGVPLFQEQVMKLAIVGAGYTPGEADQLRRDMAAWKRNGRLLRHRDRLIAGFRQRGIERDFAERLFEQVKGFGDYGFPESHAASFAILVYASAWIKTHYPAVFACALINSQPMGFYTPSQIATDAQEHGVVVRPASVQFSDWDCSLERDPDPHRSGDDAKTAEPLRLRLGLRLVKGLGEEEGRRIEEERKARGTFKDVNDVLRRCRVSLKAQQALARAGAFDDITTHRRAAIWNAMVSQPPLLQYVRDVDVERAIEAPEQLDLLQMDYAHTGVSVDDHPMRHLRPELPDILRRLSPGLERQRCLTAKETAAVSHKTRAVVVGLVTGRQRPGTADGTCFVTLEDETGMSNVVVWGRDFERWRTAIVTSPFLAVEGVVEREGIVVHFIAKAVHGFRPQANLARRSRDFH